MKVYLEGHRYEYEIENMIHLFFTNKKIEFIYDKYQLNETDIFISSILKNTGGQISVSTRIVLNGDVKENNIIQKYDSSMSPDEYSKLCKSAVKLSFYRAAKQVSPVNVPWGTLTGIRPTKIVHSLIQEGRSDKEIEKILLEQYEVSTEKAKLALDVAYNELKILKQSQPNSIGLYIGIPFCPTRCLYCSFVSNSVQRAQKFIEPYMEALIREIQHTGTIINNMGWQVESIYIGGGTPTVLTPVFLEKLLSAVCAHINLQSVKEFTVEAGRPDTIDQEKLRIIKKYGASRLSINPQTMNLSTLQTIGRCHMPEDIVKSFGMARSLGFGNINMDVIAGLPDETVDMYKNTLIQVQELDPESVTVHTMSIKRASRLNEKIDEYTITQANAVQDMLLFTQQFMREHNKYPYYMYRQKNILGNLENVGYCKPNFECIYNVQIMEEKQSIIAVGCGAVTKMVNLENNRIERIFNVKDVEEYIKRIDEMLIRKNKIYEYFS
ncbi:coproporphyrinogen dehydrogenase HemZ [Petroclostridium xylanilyticum]|uniref:coproporphyrinogen dehydrogenase HemZ n=1 Tax=Petroclostridium xylanilyticum TaxID=1792311 RepID=UPI000B98FED5|nr:coproporphyrinogen dehydrogenase HemZ [Petroclostridium xylanilyticum]